MRIVPVLFPCDLGHSDGGAYVEGGERGAPDILLDQLEGEGVRLATPVSVPVPVPEHPADRDAVLKFDRELRAATVSLAEVVAGINRDANFPLILGGDHTALWGHVLGHSIQHPDGVGIAVLADAVADLEAPGVPAHGDKAILKSDPSRPKTGDGARMVLAGALRRFDPQTEMAQALQKSSAVPKQVSVAGVRAAETAQTKQQLKTTQVDVWTMERLELDGESAYRSVLNRHLAQGPILLSVDVCGIDPHLMPAVRESFGDGLDWSFLKRSLEQCVPHVDRLLGLDVCGLDPTRDDAYKMASGRLAETLAPFLQRLV